MKKIILQFLSLFVLAGALHAQEPDWSVNSSNYSNSMSVTCVLVMDGEESTDGNDLIGAFIDGECRGVKSPIYLDAIDRWVAFLVIFSNESSGTVSFKLYDDSENQVYDAGATIEFEANAHFGMATAPFVWSDSEIPEESEILAFNIQGQTAETNISDNEVSIIMPEGTSLTALVPAFELSEYATTRVNGVVQTSGISGQNFTNPVEYTVYAVNNSDSSKYLVSVYAGDASTFSASNTFSPNGDGINDYWEVEDINRFRNCNFYIYSSIGEIVYESLGYNNDWDGTKNGSQLPIGTYYYIVKCKDCSSCKFSGFISIIR